MQWAPLSQIVDCHIDLLFQTANVYYIITSADFEDCVHSMYLYILARFITTKFDDNSLKTFPSTTQILVLLIVPQSILQLSSTSDRVEHHPTADVFIVMARSVNLILSQSSKHQLSDSIQYFGRMHLYSKIPLRK